MICENGQKVFKKYSIIARIVAKQSYVMPYPLLSRQPWILFQ